MHDDRTIDTDIIVLRDTNVAIILLLIHLCKYTKRGDISQITPSEHTTTDVNRNENDILCLRTRYHIAVEIF